MKMRYGKGGGFVGGFLADQEGNLIDLNGKVLTRLEDMSNILKSRMKAMVDGVADPNEFWACDGILIKKII